MTDVPIDLGQNYRYPAPPALEGASITVIADGIDAPSFDPSDGTTQIDLPDGSVQITFGEPEKKKRTSTGFNDNLAEDLSDSDCASIAEKLLLGIDQDVQSRSMWLENMANGISLLGLEIKNPRGAAASGATPQEGVSTVDHPLLLEAVLRFQANARGELLPTDGPVKVRNDGEGNELADKLADALEKDMNHYLTKVAKEYYPDTDKLLFMVGFSGIGFKKGFHCPIRRRPVIESIDSKDLIVSNAATNLEGAGRVTHRIMMRPPVLRRMQLLGAYLDIKLHNPGMPAVQNPVDTKINQTQGIAPPTYVENEEQDRELYECYCEIEVPGFEHEIDGKQTGLPLPYKVTIDRESRRILEIRRNWAEDDEFCMPLNRIIAYIFIPGLGFYGIGLLNVLGNATKAVTAAWRLMIDAGMFANFPGFLYLKNLAKQLTNQFRIPPGGGMAIDATGPNADVRRMIMPLPYKDASPVFMQLIENVVQTAQRVGGTAELQIGEGKADAPVGTTLAMVEQATKLMSAVHKRLHQAQGQELDLLKTLLMEDPEALWRHHKKSKILKELTAMAGQQPVVDAEESAEDRHRALFLAALSDCELIPRADPNTSSHTERYLKIVAMRQMAMTPGSNMDLNKVDERGLSAIGVDDPDSLMKDPPPPGAPPPPPSPEQLTAQATMMAAQARVSEAQARAADAAAKARQSTVDTATDAQIKMAELAAKERIAAQEVAKETVIHQADQAKEERAAQMENEQRSADRLHKLAMASVQSRASARDSALQRAHDMRQTNQGLAHEAIQSHLDRTHEAGLAGAAQQHEAGLEHGGRVHEAMQAHADRINEGLGRAHEAQQNAVDRQHEGLARSFEADQNEKDRAHEIAKIKATPKPPKGNRGKK